MVIGGQLFSQEDPCWNNFRGDQALTGISTFTIPDDPDIIWIFKTGDEVKASPVVCGDRIIIGSTDGYAYCLNFSGKLQWKFNTENAIEAPALIVKDRVYVGNMDGSLFCFNLNTGEHYWTYEADNQISGSPNYWWIEDRLYIMVGSYDYYLHCVDGYSGTMIWKYEADNFINGAPACRDGKAVFGGCDGLLHIVDIRTGESVDRIEVATYVAGSAALYGNSAFVGDYDGKFSCIDIKKKEIKWQWESKEGMLPFIASPSVDGKRVIIGNRDKWVYCFDTFSGQMQWKYNSGGRIEASALVAENKVIVPTMIGDIIILSTKDGKELWTYELGAPLYSNPALSNGFFVIGSADGTIYCFGQDN